MVSSGAAAGIGISCTIAGILIMGAVFYLVGHRRRQLAAAVATSDERGINEEEITIGGEKIREPPPIADLTRPISTSTASSYLSLGTTDTKTKQLFHRLNVAIRGHAQLYYSTTTSSQLDLSTFCDANISTLSEILSPNAPVDATSMDALLRNPETRTDAIRLLIAWAIFKYIAPEADLDRTLLPPEMVKCAQAMSRDHGASAHVDHQVIPRKPVPTEGNNSITSITVVRPAVTPTDDHIAFAKWRETSGKLFAPIYGDGKFEVGDSRDHNIGELVTVLVCLLQPYVAKGYGGARVRDLENVIKAGAAFGYRLFTQRPEWEFAWSTLMADEIVVYPALVKIGDEKGERLRKSVVLDWEETVKLAEPMELLVSKRASVHKDASA